MTDSTIGTTANVTSYKAPTAAQGQMAISLSTGTNSTSTAADIATTLPGNDERKCSFIIFALNETNCIIAVVGIGVAFIALVVAVCVLALIRLKLRRRFKVNTPEQENIVLVEMSHEKDNQESPAELRIDDGSTDDAASNQASELLNEASTSSNSDQKLEPIKEEPESGKDDLKIEHETKVDEVTENLIEPTESKAEEPVARKEEKRSNTSFRRDGYTQVSKVGSRRSKKISTQEERVNSDKEEVIIVTSKKSFRRAGSKNFATRAAVREVVTLQEESPDPYLQVTVHQGEQPDVLEKTENDYDVLFAGRPKADSHRKNTYDNVVVKRPGSIKIQTNKFDYDDLPPPPPTPPETPTAGKARQKGGTEGVYDLAEDVEG